MYDNKGCNDQVFYNLYLFICFDSGSTQSSAENTNFAKLSRIIIDLFGGVLRDIVDACQDPASFPVNQLLGNKNIRLTTEQKDVIKHVIIDGNYKRFDISLLYTTIRNVCLNRNPPTAGWGKPVNCNDCTLADDVERLRVYRNQVYGHVVAAKVDTNKYQSLLTEIELICKRFDTCPTHVG